MNKAAVCGGLIVVGSYLFIRGWFHSVYDVPPVPEDKEKLFNEAANVAIASIGGAMFAFAISQADCVNRGGWVD